jgi:hypothetical protein
MRPPGPTFTEAIDKVSQHPFVKYEGAFFARVRQCKNMPPARTPNDYMELAGSLFVAWWVALALPMGQDQRKFVLQIGDAIRSLLKIDMSIDPSVRRYLERREQEYAARASRGNLDVGIEDFGFPKRRDHLTFADLGRECGSAGPMLFVREVSAAMRTIFGKPHDKIVGKLAGLAFGTEALSVDTVRTMRKKTGLTPPNNARVKPLLRRKRSNSTK